MAVRSQLPGFSAAQARAVLEGLPRCDYDIVVAPLRYRWAPHLAARCEFEERRIVLQVPIPWRPFKEPVIYAARRKRGRSEEHTSELQSRRDLVCRLLLEKKKESRTLTN